MATINLDPSVDNDGDGASANQGDCNDLDPAIGKKAFEVPGNAVDDDCDGMIDEATGACDGNVIGMKTANAMLQAIGLCDSQFVTGVMFAGPSDDRSRVVAASFGVVGAEEGQSLAVFSTGEVKTTGYNPEPGTELQLAGPANEVPNPVPGLTTPLGPGCGIFPITLPVVFDYTELVLDLVVPQNATGLSFKFQFLSAEYPEYVCTPYNDRFLVVMGDAAGTVKNNIAFDSAMNAISVNNGFFTICQNFGFNPNTQKCMQPVSMIANTGYEQLDMNGTMPVGGSTGWLTTTAPVTPNAPVRLRFMIFDEGDHKLDSAVLLDKFEWEFGVVADAPVTVQ
jgi:hypothetical protein